MKKLTPWMAAMLIAFWTGANAQESVQPDGHVQPPADCRAAPADQPAGEGVALPPESKLEDCGAVLKPPASADSEIAVHPMQGGETPVIPPSQVPPSQDGNTN